MNKNSAQQEPGQFSQALRLRSVGDIINSDVVEVFTLGISVLFSISDLCFNLLENQPLAAAVRSGETFRRLERST